MAQRWEKTDGKCSYDDLENGIYPCDDKNSEGSFAKKNNF
jgi:hypothetical protein